MATFRRRGKVWEYRLREFNISKSGYKTKSEAKIAATEIEFSLKRGSKIDKSSTVFDIWERWFKLEILPSNKSDRTKDKYKKVGTQIKKYFGTKVAYSLRYSEYQQILNEYGQHVGVDTLSRFNSAIRNSIIQAKKDFITLNDFTLGVKLNAKMKPKPANEKFIESISDYQKILSYLKQQMNYPESIMPYFFYIQLKTGFRVGEVLALTWKEIDFENKFISTYRRIDSARHTFVPPKTDTSVRTVPISDDVLNVLISLKEKQKLMGLLKITDNLIFFDELTGLPTNNGLNKALKKYLETLSIYPLITATGCRHTYCSVLLAKGVDISVLAKYMGHKNTQRIITTYGHVLQELEEKENDQVRDLLKSF
ncbi:site-specific integrase [Dellaglioa algida]|uniref:site-specific integrase n=1 Tax=Dellaglioa algida TaxID=105612 RepID=UPI000B1B1371|nr:site-specific integrase [Dellaglioa algida]MDK1733318.1 site-specific integrase [Dellaglioa algida]MDK1734765.1 site-specific integrase [Dellaglioa algida]